MWVITLISKETVKMYEFDSEIEAKQVFEKATGTKYLSQIIYYNDDLEFAA
ncbi:hypothetical protein [Sporosarcina sp. HYO08]|uniref:hypothetical protein n=1 Tax=Sporosarcina sp. HYO08 TaxID=1759557 RepID=UPI00155E2734|nr:hypothetical protein [Sporosarcina sp. HYO08]